jgi:hypothetical protein
MFNLNIDNRTIKFPDKLTVHQWQQVARYKLEDPTSWTRVLATLMDIHPNDLYNLSNKNLELAMGIVFTLLKDRKETPWKDPHTLTFGEWVDLDCWIAEGINNTLDKMLEILAPDVETSAEALYVIESYITWRTYIYRQYAELFGINVEDDEIVEEPVEKQVGPKDIVNGWYSVIIGLASDNILNVEAVTEQPVISTLNFMAHQKQKQIAENFKKLKQQKEYELQRRRK